MQVKNIVAGIISLAVGINFTTNKGGSLYGQPVPYYSGFVLIVFGFFLLYLGLFRKKQVAIDYICPKCDNFLEYIKGKTINCPVCGTKMEKLKGFYQRHPEKGSNSE